MTLLEPRYLWALLVLPILWWLSQPPKPRHQILTPHFQQWQVAMRALRRRPPRGSLLRWLLLSLAVIATIIAAARPFIPAMRGPQRLVVLLDASLSMSAKVSGQAAFDVIKARLAQGLEDVPEYIDVTVLRCGGDLRRRHGKSARSLNDLGDPLGPLDVDLVALADKTASADCVVWTLTDGQGQAELPSVGALTVVDARGANAAITAVRLTDGWPLPAVMLEVDVVAFAPLSLGEHVPAQLKVMGAVTQEQRLPVELLPGEPTTLRVSLQRSKEGGDVVLELLLAEDCLALDNRYVLTLPPLPAPRIAALVDGEAGPFAAAAAEALAVEVQGEVVDAKVGAEVGLLLVDGGFVPLQDSLGNLAQQRALTFGTRLSGEVEPIAWLAPTPLDWSRTSPLTRGLDLSELLIDRAWRGILPAGDAFLWWYDGDTRVPLGVLVDNGKLQDGSLVASIHLAFRLQDSNLPLLPAFPQLLRRAFVRSYGEAAIATESLAVLAVGEHNLLTPAIAEDRSLPSFGGVETPLARWFVLAGLLAFALRAFVR